MFENRITFDGSTFNQANDGERLKSQLDRVLELMLDGKWRTLEEIEAGIKVEGKKDSQAAISARLRDFRKEKFGSYEVNARHRGNPKNGLYEYQVLNKLVEIKQGQQVQYSFT